MFFYCFLLYWKINFTDALYSYFIPTAGAETIITSDQAVRGGKIIELKSTVDAAVTQCPDVKRVFVAQRTGSKVSKTDKDIPLEEVSVLFNGFVMEC